MEPRGLYQGPFTDIDAERVNGVFPRAAGFQLLEQLLNEGGRTDAAWRNQ